MFEDMPKAELHVHLDGMLPPRTVLQLAERNNLLDLLPGDTPEAITSWFVFRDFFHFVEIIRIMKRLLSSADNIALAVLAAGQELHHQHIRYAEVTITPYSLIDILHPQLSIEELLHGLEAGRQRVREAFGVELRWVFDIPRNRAFSDYRNGGDYVPGTAETTLDYALLGRDYGVIGLGLGGNEVNAPPEAFAHVFARAKSEGLKSLPHAGESEGAASIHGAINALQADRIGHGVRAIEDQYLLDELVDRRIPLEVSMTCNVHLNFYDRLEDHPLPLLDGAGIMVTINTDDPGLVGTTLSREYQLLVDTFGYSTSDVIRIARNAFVASYAEPEMKSKLLAEFDAWVGSLRLECS
jgi:aminodeoxyfutalosine deaminase